MHIFSIAFQRQCGPLTVLRAEPNPEPTVIEVDPAIHVHKLLADSLRPRLSGSRAVKDQQDRNAFRLITTSRFGETGYPSIQSFITRGTGLNGKEDDGGDGSDEAVAVTQKKRKCQ